MAINIDTIRNLDENRTYYLGNASNDIKEAGWWQKLKCLFHLGDGRSKVRKLVVEIREKFMAEAGQIQNDEFDNALRRINTDSSISGRELKALAEKFADKNRDSIHRTRAATVAEDVLDRTLRAQMAKDDLIVNQDNATLSQIARVDRSALEAIMKHALKPLLANPPLLTATDAVDVMAVKTKAQEFLDALVGELKQIMRDHAGEKSFTLDLFYAQHIIAKLYDAQGLRNGTGANALDTLKKVHADAALPPGSAARKALEQASLNRTAKGLGPIDPEKYVHDFVSFCGRDLDMQELAIKLLPDLCLDGDGNLRGIADIQDDLDKIGNNLTRVREEAHGNNGTYSQTLEHMKSAILALKGRAFPRNMITDIARIVRETRLPHLACINGLSTAAELHGALEDLSGLYRRLKRELHTDLAQKLDGIEDTEPMDGALLKAMLAFVFADMNAVSRARLVRALRAPESLRLYDALSAKHRELSAEMDGDPDRRAFIGECIAIETRVWCEAGDQLGVVQTDASAAGGDTGETGPESRESAVTSFAELDAGQQIMQTWEDEYRVEQQGLTAAAAILQQAAARAEAVVKSEVERNATLAKMNLHPDPASVECFKTLARHAVSRLLLGCLPGGAYENDTAKFEKAIKDTIFALTAQLNTFEFMAAVGHFDLPIEKKITVDGQEKELNFHRIKFDELHMRALIPLLFKPNGDVARNVTKGATYPRTPDFQKHADEVMSLPLGDWKDPLSIVKFRKALTAQIDEW